MIHEIKNMSEYNPRYSEHRQLKWQKINDGKHPKKQFNTININKITIYKNNLDAGTFERSKKQYEQSHELIPILLRKYDNQLMSGYEQYILAKTLGITEIPYIQYVDHSINRKPFCNKTKAITDYTGKKIYVTPEVYKQVSECYVMCKQLGLRMEILPIYRFKLYYEKSGRCLRKHGYKQDEVYERLKIMLANKESKGDNN